MLLRIVKSLTWTLNLRDPFPERIHVTTLGLIMVILVAINFYDTFLFGIFSMRIKLNRIHFLYNIINMSATQ